VNPNAPSLKLSVVSSVSEVLHQEIPGVNLINMPENTSEIPYVVSDHHLCYLQGGGGIYYTRVVHSLNYEFTENKHAGMYGWLSLHTLQDVNGAHTIPGGRSHKTLTNCRLAGRLNSWTSG
jgi:hypothetical protein